MCLQKQNEATSGTMAFVALLSTLTEIVHWMRYNLQCVMDQSYRGELYKAIDWQKSAPVPASFFDDGGKRIKYADVIYRCYITGTDYYFYWVIEHKDGIVHSHRPFLQLLGYSLRTCEWDRGRLQLPLLLLGSNCKFDGYVDALLGKLGKCNQTRHLATLLVRNRAAFLDCQPPVLAMPNVPDTALLNRNLLRSGAVFYAIKHRQQLQPERIAILLGLCRAMIARGKEVVVNGTICYAVAASGLDFAAWRRIEFENTPHLQDEERVMHKREFGLTAMMKDMRAEGKAEGKVEGKAEGKVEGKAEGKVEERSKIALHMLQEGETEAKICRVTSLTRKELQLLKRSLKK